jgi:transposase
MPPVFWQAGGRDELASRKACSQDLSERVLAAVDGGMPVYEAAPLFRVSVSYIYKMRLRRLPTGETAALQHCCQLTRALAASYDAIGAEAAARPQVTLAELRAWLLAAHGVSASLGGMWNAADWFGLTLKKDPPRCGSRSAPALPTHEMPGASGSQCLNPTRLLFIDETRATPTRHAPAAAARAASGCAPLCRTATGKPRPSSPGIIAPSSSTAPSTSPSARAGARTRLDVSAEDVVVMDNLRSHKVPGVRDAIEGPRRQPRIPASLFARFQSDRAGPRQAQGIPQSRRRSLAPADTLWSAIGQLLDHFPPEECANLANCGYRQSA